MPERPLLRPALHRLLRPALRGFLRRLAALGLAALAGHATAAPAPLPPEVDAALQRAGVPRESLVVVAQEVGARAPRLAWQPQQPVNPASLMKLVTTSAALDLLGPAWAWKTPVWLDGSIGHGVLKGNLVIKGSGDPKLVQERLWQMLRRVRQLGVREIRGDIVIDRSAFAVPPHDPAAFDNEPLRPSNVGPDALLLNFKSVQLTFTPDVAHRRAIVSSEPPLAGVRVDASVPLSAGPCDDWRGTLKPDFSAQRLHFGGRYPASCLERQWPVAYPDPADYNARALAGLWREMGGRLSGRVREGPAPEDAPSFELTSPPLAELIRDINKFSNNVMAQQLFLTLAITQRGGAATPEQAREVLQMWLAERFGMALVQGTVIDNGSGLSRASRITAQLLAHLLQAGYAGPSMPELMSSLPVSGVDGTLRRMHNGAAGRAHLKTGSLRDVVGVAGYVLGNSGKRYVLVAIVNDPRAGDARPALEALAQWTANDVAASPLAGAPSSPTSALVPAPGQE
ncbi:MAG: D-alanyl-D-alanine carboxypeptidase/D-alanyl-D-alanine-endopeptidase [Rhizobacter sp.]|nr:D-alanyl-D-alanine carboxypeptidase/D-alanyl-D-alanine-endopeptidase [Rhizobacter sp.]